MGFVENPGREGRNKLARAVTVCTGTLPCTINRCRVGTLSIMPTSTLHSYNSSAFLRHTGSHLTTLQPYTAQSVLALGGIDREGCPEFICHMCVNLLCSARNCRLIHFLQAINDEKKKKSARGPTLGSNSLRRTIWERKSSNSLKQGLHSSRVFESHTSVGESGRIGEKHFPI